MARLANRLTAKFVTAVTEQGLYPDGRGLYLQVTKTGTKSWIKRYARDGRHREMGLGPVRLVSLPAARAANLAIDTDRLKGIDPLDAKRARRDAARVQRARTATFKTVAEAHIRAQRGAWRSGASEQQWRQSLRDYAYPVFGELPVAEIDTALVLKVVEPLWQVKPETGARVLQRIAAVLDRATSHGQREGANPARLKGHMANLLPAKAKIHKVVHHAALPYAEIGDFVGRLRQNHTIASRALELLILTATRASTAFGAKWSEFNIDERVWSVPPERDKTGIGYRIPLADPTLRLLAHQREVALDGFVFAIRSRSALGRQLRAMGDAGITPHGFRSCFADWAAECTSFPAEVREMALGHKVPSAVERAYRRGDLFEKRRALMAAWAAFVGTPSRSARGSVVAIGGVR
jgi:integrase